MRRRRMSSSRRRMRGMRSRKERGSRWRRRRRSGKIRRGRRRYWCRYSLHDRSDYSFCSFPKTRHWHSFGTLTIPLTCVRFPRFVCVWLTCCQKKFGHPKNLSLWLFSLFCFSRWCVGLECLIFSYPRSKKHCLDFLCFFTRCRS